MTRDQALETVAAMQYAKRKTFEEYLAAYRRLRAGASHLYITREMVAAEHGSKSQGMASAAMKLIEPMEGDQAPRRSRTKKGEAAATDGLPHLPEVDKAIEAARIAFDNLSRAFQAGRAIDRLAMSEHYQILLTQQAAEFAADRLAADEREADLEAAASGAGDEAWDNSIAVEAALALATTAKAERDSTIATLDDVNRARELDRVRSAAEIERLERDVALRTNEVVTLTASANTLTGKLSDHRAENAVLQEKVATLSEQVAQQQAILAACEARHERDRRALEGELAGERERASKRETDLLAWLGKHSRGADDGGVA
ncbi:hypothetical protein RPMA_18490 [Tardiphaga alba]|uniref:Uncharacterized protein n=1 Tax=Tardiphaga alba TaxID=340268 RepID=A0ABX8AA26_9BRAD|nr:hypothetical protein [Tardiphaga alba]QUS40606.1 hypothetical protein RPMA_18490 [Tardiphaga alba]